MKRDKTWLLKGAYNSWQSKTTILLQPFVLTIFLCIPCFIVLSNIIHKNNFNFHGLEVLFAGAISMLFNYLLDKIFLYKIGNNRKWQKVFLEGKIKANTEYNLDKELSELEKTMQEELTNKKNSLNKRKSELMEESNVAYNLIKELYL